jgi:hypothetical protein
MQSEFSGSVSNFANTLCVRVNVPSSEGLFEKMFKWSRIDTAFSSSLIGDYFASGFFESKKFIF